MPPDVTIRAFDEATERPLLRRWLHRPHVSRWWGDPDREYRYCTTHPHGGRGLTICVDDRPVGFIYIETAQRERLEAANLGEIPDRAYDMDILIGETDCLGMGIGPRALELLLAELFADPAVPLVGLTTSVENGRAQAAFSKVGFRPYKEFDDPEYGRCVVMVCSRPASGTGTA